MRRYCKALIQFLLEKYDEVLANDQRWIIAKCNIQTDEFYSRLVLGDNIVLITQSYGESEESLTSPIKRVIMASSQAKSKTKKRVANQRSGPAKGNPTGSRGPRVKNVQGSNGKVQAVFAIPHCAMDYMSALGAPFETPTGVCIPAETFPLPSQKMKAFLKGRMALGTTGFGYITVSPAITATAPVVKTTTASTVLSGAANLISSTNTQFLPVPQIILTEAQRVAGEYEARIVSYGLRVKYIGKLMDRNGVATSIEEPDHGNLSSQSIDEINASRYSEIRRIGPDLWDHEVYYSGPVTPSEVEFVSTVNPLGGSIAGIVIEGVAGDSYEFEYVQHFEVIGTAAGARTKSHSDPATFGKALEAAKTTATDGPLTSAKIPSLMERFLNGIKSLAPAVISAGKMVPALLTGHIPEGLLEAAKLQKSLTSVFSLMNASNYAKAISGTGPRGHSGTLAIKN
jgi:hypothetical protein